MTDETTDVAADSTTVDAKTNISIEQICAAILATVNSVEVPLEVLLANYSNKAIAVNQDEDTKAITFSLADAPAAPETPAAEVPAEEDAEDEVE